MPTEFSEWESDITDSFGNAVARDWALDKEVTEWKNSVHSFRFDNPSKSDYENKYLVRPIAIVHRDFRTWDKAWEIMCVRNDENFGSYAGYIKSSSQPSEEEVIAAAKEFFASCDE